MDDKPFQLVSARFNTGGKPYSYKIPADWKPQPGQMMKVQSRGGGWKAVEIAHVGVALDPNINYAWGLELVPLEQWAPDWHDAPRHEPTLDGAGKPVEDPNPGGVSTGAKLAEELLSAIKCRVCDGTGQVPGMEPGQNLVCGACGGTGWTR